MAICAINRTKPFSDFILYAKPISDFIKLINVMLIQIIGTRPLGLQL